MEKFNALMAQFLSAMATLLFTYALLFSALYATRPPGGGLDGPEGAGFLLAGISVAVSFMSGLFEALVAALTGDWGQSTYLGQSVAAIVGQAVPRTGILLASGVQIGVAMALGMAILATVLRPDRRFGAAPTPAGSTVLGVVPAFMWAMILWLAWTTAHPLLSDLGASHQGTAYNLIPGSQLPGAGVVADRGRFSGPVVQWAVPAVSLGLAFGFTLRGAAQAALALAYREDHVSAARMRGVSEWHILMRHVLPRAVGPVLAAVRTHFSALAGATLLVEVACDQPGMGRHIVMAVRDTDVPVVLGLGMAFALLTIVARIALDALSLASAGRQMP